MRLSTQQEDVLLLTLSLDGRCTWGVVMHSLGVSELGAVRILRALLAGNYVSRRYSWCDSIVNLTEKGRIACALLMAKNPAAGRAFLEIR